jgi:trimethylamine--corrinoid protein Co-methyltransferase
MKLQGQVLSEDERERVHKESLRILAEAGIRVHSEGALKVLERGGAKVDWDAKIARIPNEMVTEALSRAPKKFMLGARNPIYNYPLPSPVSRYALDGTAAFVQDFETGERRYGRSRDTEDGARIFQAMDMGVMVWAPVCAEDKPAHSRPLHEFFTMAKFCSKHGQHELHTAAQAPYLMEGLKVIMGGADEVRARNAFSLVYCPVAPLVHDGPMLDAYLQLGKLGVPVMTLPMPVTGTTGPASLFSTVCLGNAEALSSFVIFEFAHPGRPIIHASATGNMDMHTGGFLGGTPEMGLMSAALVEMGRYYGFPSASAGCTADAREAGAQAVLEKLITTLPPVLSGSDIIVGFGEVESDQLLILEQIVVDNEIAHFCERLVNGIDSEKVFTEDVIRVGPGGNFLAMKSTRAQARSDEFMVPTLFDRHNTDQWIELGKPSMYSKARDKVREILAAPLVDPLPDSIIAALDEILAKADEELKEQA